MLNSLRSPFPDWFGACGAQSVFPGCRASPLGISPTSPSQVVPDPGAAAVGIASPFSSLPALLSFYGRAGHLQPREDPPRLHQRHRPGGLQHLEASFPEPLRLHVHRASCGAHHNPSGCSRYVSQPPWDRVLGMVSSLLSRSYPTKGSCFVWRHHINYPSPRWDTGLQQRQVMLHLLRGRHLLHRSFLLVLRNASHFPVLGQVLESHHEPEPPQICSPLIQTLGHSRVQHHM